MMLTSSWHTPRVRPRAVHTPQKLRRISFAITSEGGAALKKSRDSLNCHDIAVAWLALGDLLFSKDQRIDKGARIRLLRFVTEMCGEEKTENPNRVVVPPPYAIDFLNGNEDDPSILIRSKSVRGLVEPIKHRDDGRFLLWLGRMKATEPFCVTKKTVCGIFGAAEEIKHREETYLSEDVQKQAGVYISSFRRRLRRRGIEPGELIVPERTFGWRLHPDVKLGKGFASVFSYSSGFRIDDLPDRTSAPWDDQ